MILNKLSFVIACYNSEKTVENVINEIQNTMLERKQVEYEIITVVDCSPDNVFFTLSKQAETNKKLKVIELAKNVGKHAALMAGYSYVDGDIVVTLDDDGQCPVNRLWELLEPLNDNYDIAIAKNGKKKQTPLRNFGSWVNAKMSEFFIGKPKDIQLANFFAMKRYVCDEILKYKNPYPYIDGLYLRTTSKICNVPMEERERQTGKSGYTLKKCLSLFANGFTSFSVKPLRVAMLFGVLCSFLGLCIVVFVIAQKILNPAILAGYTSLMAVILLVGGVIMILLGVIGEYVGRIYISINSAPQYVIRQSIHCDSLNEGSTNK